MTRKYCSITKADYWEAMFRIHHHNLELQGPRENFDICNCFMSVIFESDNFKKVHYFGLFHGPETRFLFGDFSCIWVNLSTYMITIVFKSSLTYIRATQPACLFSRKCTNFSINLSQAVSHFTAYSPSLLVCVTVPKPAQQDLGGLSCEKNDQLCNQKCLTLLPILPSWVTEYFWTGHGLEPTGSQHPRLPVTFLLDGKPYGAWSTLAATDGWQSGE